MAYYFLGNIAHLTSHGFCCFLEKLFFKTELFNWKKLLTFCEFFQNEVLLFRSKDEDRHFSSRVEEKLNLLERIGLEELPLQKLKLD